MATQWVRQAGAWKQTTSHVKVSGAFKQVKHVTVPTYDRLVLESSPIGYWKLAETSGTTAADSSPNARHGTYTNGVTLNQTGPRSGTNSATFTRSSSQYVSVPTSGLPTAGAPYTIEAWIKPTAIDNLQGIFGYGNYGTTHQANALRLGTNSGNQLHNYWWGNDFVVTTALVVANSWMHVVATFDGTNRRMYVNSQIIGTMASSNGNYQAVNPTIGKTSGSEYFNGSISRVAVYDKALTGDEVSAHYTAMK